MNGVKSPFANAANDAGKVQRVKQTSKSGSHRYDEEKELLSLLDRLFSNQRYAVLATQKAGQPYTNLVAFAAVEDGKRLIFVTPRATRKFTNIGEDPHVSMMIDNRENRASDINDAMAVSAIGVAEEVSGQEKEALLRLFLSKHPFLETFARSASCALMKISVEKYDIVREFQNVVELKMVS
jgi:nitroimidazol reductase NimA-like FMN-containing flavoprotein (pyridoxamine 5'-phosphate oxidase superfamily)